MSGLLHQAHASNIYSLYGLQPTLHFAIITHLAAVIYNWLDLSIKYLKEHCRGYIWTNSIMCQIAGCLYGTKDLAVLVLIILAKTIICIREYYAKVVVGITRWHFIFIESKILVVSAYKSFIED